MKCLDNFLDFLRDGTNRILRDQGIFFIIEAHPLLGQPAKGIKFSSEGHFHGRLSPYK